MNIVLRKISKSYNGTVALKDCDARISEGMMNAVIGPNGSGKSTLLRLASLIDEPEKGEVIYRDDSKVSGKDMSLRRKIAVVLPGDTLFNDSVFNNVAYGLKIRKAEKGSTRGKVNEILEKFKMADKAYKHAGELSSGEAQRIAVARALVIDPKYLFLDEPTASLDPVNTEIIESVLRDVNRERKITILIVTHNMFQAKRIAKRVMFMYGGKVIEESDSDKIFANPESEITRKFITGTMIF